MDSKVWAVLTESDKRSFEVEVYRCAGCGYLESYATFGKNSKNKTKF